jgi:hypothetical protein
MLLVLDFGTRWCEQLPVLIVFTGKAHPAELTLQIVIKVDPRTVMYVAMKGTVFIT